MTNCGQNRLVNLAESARKWPSVRNVRIFSAFACQLMQGKGITTLQAYMRLSCMASKLKKQSKINTKPITMVRVTGYTVSFNERDYTILSENPHDAILSERDLALDVSQNLTRFERIAQEADTLQLDPWAIAGALCVKQCLFPYNNLDFKGYDITISKTNKSQLITLSMEVYYGINLKIKISKERLFSAHILTKDEEEIHSLQDIFIPTLFMETTESRPIQD